MLETLTTETNKRPITERMINEASIDKRTERKLPNGTFDFPAYGWSERTVDGIIWGVKMLSVSRRSSLGISMFSRFTLYRNGKRVSYETVLSAIGDIEE